MADQIQASYYDDPDGQISTPLSSSSSEDCLPSAPVSLVVGASPCTRVSSSDRPDGDGSLSGSKALVRIVIAGIGLRIGADAGFWTAILWGQFGSGAAPMPTAHLDFRTIWIGSGCLFGGVLAIFGYRLGLSLPPTVAFIGAFLGLRVVRYVGPAVASLYWGPYPSSDFHALVLLMADLLTSYVF